MKKRIRKEDCEDNDEGVLRQLLKTLIFSDWLVNKGSLLFSVYWCFLLLDYNLNCLMHQALYYMHS